MRWYRRRKGNQYNLLQIRTVHRMLAGDKGSREDLPSFFSVNLAAIRDRMTDDDQYIGKMDLQGSK